MDFFITVTGYRHYFGKEIFDINETFFLKSEPDNEYDKYAVAVFSDKYGKCGYVSNSPQTMAYGTMSAKSFADYDIENIKIIIKFIAGDYIIAKLCL